MTTALLLYQNRPNPFRTRTTFAYDIGGSGRVELLIHSYTGQYITTLVDATHTNGSYAIDWDTSDTPAGIYYYTLRVEGDRLGEEGGED